MANIEELAKSAKRKLDNGQAIFEADAIRKAIVGVGIFGEKNIAPLMKKVGAAFARNKYAAQRTAARRRR